MDVLILNHREVRDLLPMDECIAALERAFVTLDEGDALQPLRWPMFLPDRSGLLGMMPGFLGGDVDMMGIKTVSVMPGNHGTEYDSHQGTIMLFEKTHGVLKAIVDATEVTAIRTAAASGVATKLLAREDSAELAIIGSGVQARSHLTAMLAVRAIQRVRVYSPNAQRLAAFADWALRRHEVVVEISADVQSAVTNADIICTTTSAATPILMGDWLSAGVHINAVGSSVKHTRELDTAAVVNAALFVDYRDSTINEAGDFLFPKQEGAIDDDHIVAELGEILSGKAAGRSSAEQITLFKSLGLAIEDIAAAHHVYQKGLAQGIGTSLEIGAKKAI
ncbi:MAG: ornithine cyclodeaminase family protein [Candidatus Promineifilaceae bacterium]